MTTQQHNKDTKTTPLTLREYCEFVVKRREEYSVPVEKVIGAFDFTD